MIYFQNVERVSFYRKTRKTCTPRRRPPERKAENGSASRTFDTQWNSPSAGQACQRNGERVQHVCHGVLSVLSRILYTNTIYFTHAIEPLSRSPSTLYRIIIIIYHSRGRFIIIYSFKSSHRTVAADATRRVTAKRGRRFQLCKLKWGKDFARWMRFVYVCVCLCVCVCVLYTHVAMTTLHHGRGSPHLSDPRRFTSLCPTTLYLCRFLYCECLPIPLERFLLLVQERHEIWRCITVRDERLAVTSSGVYERSTKARI